MENYMKKRIMILGAGVYQVPLIKKAGEMGFETVVVSHKGKYPGIPLADIFLDIDTTCTDRIVLAAEKLGISGIVTTGTDVCMPALGKVVDALGLPGTGYESACRSANKVLMKQALMEHGVPSAPFQMFTDFEEAQKFANSLGYPVMVKATDSSGSRGITKVNATEEFQYAWERAHIISRSTQIIVEQFLSGIEFGAQAFVHGDNMVATFLYRDTVTPSPYCSPIGHSMPTMLTEEQQCKSIKVVDQAVRALGLRDCISNVDLILVNGEPTVIEISARMGATCLPENISIYTGMDMYEYLIRLSMGEYPAVTIKGKQANACLLLRSNKTGTVTSLDAPDTVLQHPDLIDFRWDISVGDKVHAFKVGPDRIGHIIVKADTAEESEQLVEWMADQILVSVAE
jgi:biotin carboxylase